MFLNSLSFSLQENVWRRMGNCNTDTINVIMTLLRGEIDKLIKQFGCQFLGSCLRRANKNHISSPVSFSAVMVKETVTLPKKRNSDNGAGWVDGRDR